MGQVLRPVPPYCPLHSLVQLVHVQRVAGQTQASCGVHLTQVVLNNKRMSLLILSYIKEQNPWLNIEQNAKLDSLERS